LTAPGDSLSRFTGFKSLNLNQEPYALGNEELVECKNFDLNVGGELTKRKGFDSFGDEADLPTGYERDIMGFYRTSDFEKFIVHSNEDAWETTDGVNWSEINLGRPGTEYGLQYYNKYYFFQRNGTMIEYDSTQSPSVTNVISGSPEASFGIVFKDRIFALNGEFDHDGRENRLYFSEPGKPTSWPSTNFIDVSPGDGDVLVNMVPYTDVVFIFKKTSIWALHIEADPADWSLRQVNDRIGCVGKYALQQHKEQVYFISLDGVYRTDFTSFEELSIPIRPIFQEKELNINIARDTPVYDYLVDVEDYLLVAIETSSGTIYYKYFYDVDGWAEFSPANYTPSFFTYFFGGSNFSKGLYASEEGNPGLYFLPAQGATETDLGNPITCSFKTKETDFDAFNLVKRGKLFTLLVKKGNNLVLDAITENTLLSRSAPAPTTGDSRRIKLRGPGYFNRLQLELRETSDQSFSFFSCELVVQPKSEWVEQVA
jgi:hypothetical protein